MLLFQPLPLTGTMNACARDVTPGSARKAAGDLVVERGPALRRDPGFPQIQVHDQQAVLPEAGVDRHQVSQAADEEQRADDEHERQRHLHDDERAPQPEPLARIRASRGCRLSSPRRARCR